MIGPDHVLDLTLFCNIVILDGTRREIRDFTLRIDTHINIDCISKRNPGVILMLRTAVLSLALLSSPAFANGFQAETGSQPPQTRFVARDSIWRCAGTSCVSTNDTSTRPAIVCATLARQVGVLRSFSANGRAFSAEELQACNARARS